MGTHRKAGDGKHEYALIEGSGPAIGCFAILRSNIWTDLADCNIGMTDWNTGSEGEEWCETLCTLSEDDFLDECRKETYS